MFFSVLSSQGWQLIRQTSQATQLESGQQSNQLSNQQSGRQSGRQSGYTLTEVVCIVAVIAMLSALALPAYAKVLQVQQTDTALAAFHHSVILARSEAHKSLEYAVICPSRDGEQCATNSNDYSFGWITFINQDKDHPVMRDSGEQLIHSIQFPNSPIALIANRTTFTFRPGGKRNTNGTLMFCPDKDVNINQNFQALIISYTGRPRLDKQPRQSHIDICE